MVGIRWTAIRGIVGSLAVSGGTEKAALIRPFGARSPTFREKGDRRARLAVQLRGAISANVAHHAANRCALRQAAVRGQ